MTGTNSTQKSKLKTNEQHLWIVSLGLFFAHYFYSFYIQSKTRTINLRLKKGGLKQNTHFLFLLNIFMENTFIYWLARDYFIFYFSIITYHRIYMNIDIFRVIHNILGNCQIDIVIFLFIMPLWCKWWTHIADIYMLKWLMIFTNVQPWINLHSVLKITFNTQYGVVINRLWLPSIMMSQM